MSSYRILIVLVTVISFWVSFAMASDSALVGGYQIQLITDPDPVIAGKQTSVIIKVLRGQGLTPVSDAKVWVSAGELLKTVQTRGLNLKDGSQSQEAIEADAFGNYELKTVFDNPEPYYLKVAIKTTAAKQFNPPLAAGFKLAVIPSGNKRLRTAIVLFVFTLFTIGAVYTLYMRRKLKTSNPHGFNLLDIPWIKQLFLWKYIQPAFQVPMLLFLAMLLYLAFTDIQDAGKNLATILIWTIWWAGIIFTFVFVGRLWCFMCPVGALSEWASRIFKPEGLFPPKLRNLWLANFLFVMLTWLDIQLGVVRNPIVTGVLLMGLAILAVVIGLSYQRRTFCRYLCPIGGLIGIYSMFSAVELRPKDNDVCKCHLTKECYSGGANSYGCPMFELVPRMDSNNVCNFCGECIKSCPRNNITIRARAFFKDAWRTRKGHLDEAFMVVVLVGVSIFVTGDMLQPWQRWVESAMKLVPAQLLGIEYAYTVEMITKSVLFFSVSLLFIPGLALCAAGLSNRLVGKENHNGLRKTFITFGTMFIPVGLSMHLAHNTGHLLNESAELIPALQRVINEFTPFFIGEPNWGVAAEPLVDPAGLYWIQMGLLLIFYVFTLYSGYRLADKHYKDGSTAFKALLPMIVLSFALTIINVYLLNLPMAPRHVH